MKVLLLKYRDRYIWPWESAVLEKRPLLGIPGDLDEIVRGKKSGWERGMREATNPEMEEG